MEELSIDLLLHNGTSLIERLCTFLSAETDVCSFAPDKVTAGGGGITVQNDGFIITRTFADGSYEAYTDFYLYATLTEDSETDRYKLNELFEEIFSVCENCSDFNPGADCVFYGFKRRQYPVGVRRGNNGEELYRAGLRLYFLRNRGYR